MKPENEAEANVIKSVLAEHGIYAEIKSFHDTAYDGLFQTQKGWGVVSAPSAFHQEILEILSDLRETAADPA